MFRHRVVFSPLVLLELNIESVAVAERDGNVLPFQHVTNCPESPFACEETPWFTGFGISSLCKFCRAVTLIRRWQIAMNAAATALALLHAPARAEAICVEAFNDDGDGVRYSTLGRGTFSDSFGDAYWEHSFIIGDVAPKIVAPARTVGFRWKDSFSAIEWSADVEAVWDASVDWLLDGKAGANILFVDADFPEPSDAVMVSRMQSQGHTVTVDNSFEPNPAGLDLLVISSNADKSPLSVLNVDYNYPVPVLNMSSWGYSDIYYLTSDTLFDASDSRSLEVTDPSHPIAAGLSGTISWTTTEQGIGSLPLLAAPGATTVATDALLAIPTVVALEQGGELMGGGFRGWEGGGFFAGQNLNQSFPPGYAFSSIPRELQLAPVDVSGKQDVKFTVSLAATRGFFNGDILDVLIDPENDGTFQLVTRFQADNDGNLSDVANIYDFIGPDTVTLSPTFRDVTFDVPPGATDLVVRFEAMTTWPNEIVGIDHVRITSGGLFPAPPNGAVELDGLAASYVQDFDASLGSDPTLTGTSLPVGWATHTRGTLNTSITQTFPSGMVTPRTYNVGDGADRTLATGNILGVEKNKVQMFAQITGSTDVSAVRVMFNVEAWSGDPFADAPGEAVYDMNLDVETGDGSGFNPLLAFGQTTTGTTLVPGVLDGNDPANRASFDSGVVEVDIAAGSNLRLSFDATAQGLTERYIFGVDDVLFRIVPPGDGNGDGQLNSTDLFGILAGGKYNNPVLGPATWIEGDYNGDDLVNSTDLFLILGTGLYNAGPYTTFTPPTALASVPEPSTFTLAVFGLVALMAYALRRRTATPDPSRW